MLFDTEIEQLSVDQIREQAKLRISQVVSTGPTAASLVLLAERTFEDAQRCADQNELRQAFLRFQQGANLLSHLIKTESLKQAPKGSDVSRRVAALSTKLSIDFLGRSAMIEKDLKMLDAQKYESHLAPEQRSSVSIADRMRSLQDAGMTVGSPKRLTRDFRSPVEQIPPPLVNGHLNTAQVLHSQSPRGDETPGKILTSPSSFTTEASDGLDFSATFPSLDELDARSGEWVFPSVPTSDLHSHSASSSERHTEITPATPISPVPLPGSIDKIHTRHLPSLPQTSSVFPEMLVEWTKAGYNLLLLDARARERFEDERPKFSKSVSIEPSILLRQGLDSTQLESALVISPPQEQELFANRHQFDAVVIMDENSSAIPPPPSALASLVRIIFENEFKKSLQRPPILLIGGMARWKETFGPSMITSHSPKSQPSSETNSKGQTRLARRGHSSLVDITLERMPNSSTAAATNHNRTVSNASNSFGALANDGSKLTNITFPTPPPASLNNSSGRRQHDVERWKLASPSQSNTGNQSGSLIDYPTLLPHSLVSHPPPAIAPASERQDRRSPLSRTALTSIAPSSYPPPVLIPSRHTVTSWDDVEIGLSGLKNLGNTCYMNSTLQCLSATISFVRFFKDGRWKTAVNMLNPLGSKGQIAQNFATMVSEMWRHEFTYLSPLTFRKTFCSRNSQFAGSNQHDAQEFLSALLDGLHEDLNRILQRPPPTVITPQREAELERLPPQVASEQEWSAYLSRNDSVVVDHFQGQFRNRLQCMTCQHTSTTYNPFMYLSLPLPVKSPSRVTLYDCLNSFVGEEIMDKADAWKCPKCATLRTATKQLSLARLPPVLLIQLKRFSFNGPFTDKLETPVDFPVKGLDLSNIMPSAANSITDGNPLPAEDPRRQQPPYIYDLYAVTNHFGTLSTGHYTAYIASKGQWFLCDDSRVAPAQTSDIVGRPAYILYYKRRVTRADRV
ncbi:cysteine proteinase [Clavulina sp. PMI_390]|nr:cysteine proteinase [Clavulina sp. PMI_390]